MTLDQMIANLSPTQINDILVSDGIEQNDTISDVQHIGGPIYSYKIFNIALRKFVKKTVKIVLDKQFNFFTIEYLKIERN